MTRAQGYLPHLVLFGQGKYWIQITSRLNSLEGSDDFACACLCVEFCSYCLISRALIGSFLSSIRVQTDKILIYASFQVQLSAVKLSTFSPMIFYGPF